jgi:Aspartyl protease
VRFPFLALPGDPLTLRPAVLITVEGLEQAPQRCLVDSGSLHNRFGSWVADSAGIHLGGAPRQRVAVGGVITTARAARVELRLGETRFDAPVWFCDPWPFAFNLLGQEGFLRYFRVTISAAEEWVECEPEQR